MWKNVVLSLKCAINFKLNAAVLTLLSTVYVYFLMSKHLSIRKNKIFSTSLQYMFYFFIYVLHALLVSPYYFWWKQCFAKKSCQPWWIKVLFLSPPLSVPLHMHALIFLLEKQVCYLNSKSLPTYCEYKKKLFLQLNQQTVLRISIELPTSLLWGPSAF